MSPEADIVTKVTSTDGATVTIHTQGSGPGVVVLHGAGVTAKDYQRLANRWAPRLTVHRYNRRGCPDSAPVSGSETAQTDIDDLAAVVEATGVSQVFGHSGGGFVAMRAGLSLPLTRIAVYDPAIALAGVDFPRDFLEPFKAAVAQDDLALAFAVMGAAINRDSFAAKLPLAVQKFVVRGFLLTPPGRQMRELLPTIVPEISRILAAQGPPSDYSTVSAEVLLAYGERSSGYFGDTCRALATAVPHSRIQPVAKSAHNAANIAKPAFAEPFADFFAAA